MPGVEEAYSLIREVAGEVLGVESSFLIRRIEEKWGRKPSSWSEALDVLEVLMASWSVLEDFWEKSARILLLARIYLEAHGSWRRMFPLKGIEKVLSGRGSASSTPGTS